MTVKEDTIREIIEYELEMFLNVNTRERAPCQENPDGFRFYRGATFSVWSEEALASYHDDLLRAKAEGRNLLTLKYARMENIIPVLNDNVIIDKIVDIQTTMLKEMVAKYPHLASRGRPVEEDSPDSTSSKTYFRGELETYSDTTLELYYQNLLHCLARNENLTEKICLAMVKRAGFSTLEAAEESIGRKTVQKQK